MVIPSNFFTSSALFSGSHFSDAKQNFKLEALFAPTYIVDRDYESIKPKDPSRTLLGIPAQDIIDNASKFTRTSINNL